MYRDELDRPALGWCRSHQRRLRRPSPHAHPGGARRRGPHLLRSRRRRPHRHRAGALVELPGRRRLAGRFHDHTAVRQERLPLPGAHDHAQDQGGGACGEGRARAHQAGDPHPLPQHDLFRSRRLWRPGGLTGLLRQERAGSHARRMRLSRRSHPCPRDCRRAASGHRPEGQLQPCHGHPTPQLGPPGACVPPSSVRAPWPPSPP